MLVIGRPAKPTRQCWYFLVGGLRWSSGSLKPWNRGLAKPLWGITQTAISACDLNSMFTLHPSSIHPFIHPTLYNHHPSSPVILCASNLSFAPPNAAYRHHFWYPSLPQRIREATWRGQVVRSLSLSPGHPYFHRLLVFRSDLVSRRQPTTPLTGRSRLDLVSLCCLISRCQIILVASLFPCPCTYIYRNLPFRYRFASTSTRLDST